MSLCVHVGIQVGGLFANGPKHLCFEPYVVMKVPTRTGPRCAPSACYPCRLAPDQRLHLSKSRVQNPKI